MLKNKDSTGVTIKVDGNTVAIAESIVKYLMAHKIVQDTFPGAIVDCVHVLEDRVDVYAHGESAVHEMDIKVNFV